jgi:HTH-type transcriptional regulator/antitoxin HigA
VNDFLPAFGCVDRPAPVPDSLVTLTPGELIAREIAARGISQAELATRTGLSTKHVNQVIKDIVPLSTETALLIERVTGLSADLLGRLEATRAAREGRRTARTDLATYESWFNRFPHDILVSKRLVNPSDDIMAQTEALLRFFGAADPDAFERLYEDSLVSFRRAQQFDVDAWASAVWLRLAEVRAAEIQTDQDVPSFSRRAFIKLLDELPSVTRLPLRRAISTVQRRCLAVGVHVILQPELPRTRAWAATRWVGDRPVVILSARGKKQDTLWFNFFHESGHIVLHPKRRSAVRLEEKGDDADGHEAEANAFASDYLLRHNDPSILTNITTQEQARALAGQLEVDEGIVAGQVANATQRWRTFQKMRKSFDLGD